MSGAVEARDDLVLLVSNTGAQIVIVDMPVLGWIVGAPGAPATPVIPWALTEPWATIEVETGRRKRFPRPVRARTRARRRTPRALRNTLRFG
jgi:hypothetical protein